MAVSLLSSTLLTIGLTVLTATSSATPQTPPLPYPTLQRDYVYVVKPDDTLSSIALQFYGSEEYWTTIWNDNKDLTNQNVINEGMKLKIRMEKPLLIEDLEERNSENNEVTPVFSISNPVVTESPTPEITSTPIPTSTPETPVASIAQSSGPLTDAQIDFLGNCESGMTATRNSGNGFYGAFQFMIGTWNSMGTGYERADLAPLEVQKAAVQRLLSRSSIYTQFPGCAKKMLAAGLL